MKKDDKVMTQDLRILHLEDRAPDAELVVCELRREGFHVRACRVWTEAGFLSELRSAAPDLILADFALPSYDGLSALRVAQQECPEVPFLFVSGALGEEAAIEAMHNGAADCVAKERLGRLGPAVRRALQGVEERRQRRQAEEAFRKSELSYREIFNATHDAIFVFDAVTGRILDVNQTTLDMFGYSREELANLREEDLGFFGPLSREEAARRIRLAFTEGPQIFDWEVKRKNGEQSWVEVALRGANIHGQERVLAVVRDISERRRIQEEREKALADLRLANEELELRKTSILDLLEDLKAEIGAQKRIENALRNSEALYQSLVENIPQCILRKDRAGRFVFCNQNFCRMIGFSLDQLLGKTDAEVYPPELARKYREDDQRVMETGQSVELVEENITGEGSRFMQAFKSPVRDASAQVVGVQIIFWDISERKRAEDGLRHLAAIVESSHDGIIGKDLDGKILSWNKAAERIYGYRAGEVVGRSISILVPRDRPDELAGIMAKLKLGETVEHFRTIRIKKDGQPLHVNLTISAIRDANGSVVGASTIARDITDIVTAESALRNSESSYQMLFDKMVDGFALHEILCNEAGQPVDYRFLAVNPSFERLTGLKAQAVVGRTAREVIPEIEAFWIETYGRVALTGEPASFERYERQMGRHFAVAAFCPAPGKFACMFLDITEHKRAEENIQRSQAELEAIYDGAPLMMCLLNREHQVERMNRTMAEFAGGHLSLDAPKRPGDVLGCASALDDPRGCNFGTQCLTCPWRLAVVKTFETGQPCRQVEATVVMVQGGIRREVQFSASTALVRLQDQPKVLVCLEDVTTRKQLQAQFLHAQKMDAIGQLAGGVAHDFNNILAASLLHLQLLQQKQDLEPELAASLRELQQGTQRAASLTRQLLLFSRRQVMQTKRLDFNEVIKGLLKMLTRLLGEDIDTVFTPGPEPVWVEADVGMLEQVVMNLCVNARDAMPRGGYLDLRARRLALDDEEVRQHPEARTGLFACLMVTDTGCGMDEATLKRIFEPFFTTKEPGKGTGLGLATVRSIVQQHHGWVQVESVVGLGTTFRVFLPAAEPPEAAELQAGQAKCRGGTETILLVEDDEQVRRMVRMTLRLFGYEVLEAGNGIEAIRMWEHHGAKVSLVFTDMVMPGGLSGLDLAERLRQSKPALKALISSGYAPDLIQRQGGLPAGMRFLAKPYDPKSLGKVVREFLDEKE
jgi:PAS domain S-box-containing protein